MIMNNIHLSNDIGILFNYYLFHLFNDNNLFKLLHKINKKNFI